MSIALRQTQWKLQSLSCLRRLKGMSSVAASPTDSNSSGGSTRATAAPASPQADPFTASLQQKAEEELLHMGLKQQQQQQQADPLAAAAPDSTSPAQSTAGNELAGNKVPQPPHGKQEIGGYAGPEPTRYSDWEIKGRCTDF